MGLKQQGRERWGGDGLWARHVHPARLQWEARFLLQEGSQITGKSGEEEEYNMTCLVFERMTLAAVLKMCRRGQV